MLTKIKRKTEKDLTKNMITAFSSTTKEIDEFSLTL